MNIIIAFLCIFLCSFQKQNGDLTDTLHFNGTKFNLVNSENIEGVYMMKEYIPEGENEDYYFQKITILIDASETNLNNSVKSQINEFKDRKKKDPTFKYSLTEDANGNYYVFDYISNKMKDSMMDFNLLKLCIVNGFENKPSICMINYKMRSYQSDIPSFLKYISESKPQYIEEIRVANFIK